MSHVPDWVFEASASMLAKRYVMGDFPIESYARKFSKILSERYSDCSPERLLAAAEGILTFLGEIEGENSITLCDAFTRNVLTLDKSGRPRRIKGFLFNAFAPAKVPTSSDAVVRAFRAFVFRLRSNPDLMAPRNWSPREVPEIEWLIGVFEVQVNFADAI